MRITFNPDNVYLFRKDEDVEMNSSRVIDTGIKGKVLCSFCDGRILVYRKGKFYVYSPDFLKIISEFELPLNDIKKIFSKFRLIERVLHVEPRWAVPINQEETLIFYSGKMYHINTMTGKQYSEELPVRGKPLSITHIEGVKGFHDSYLLGDYGTNNEREPVSVYQRPDDSGSWKVVYTFPAGTVRHVHNIIQDADEDRVLILTGDEDAESGVWAAYNNFASVVPILVGEQRYRACQAFSSNGEVYLLSDKPSEANYLWKIDSVGKEIPQIQLLRGSCIYGTGTLGKGYFSTTCEPDAHARNKIDYWLSTHPGKGIKDNSIDIMEFNNGKCEPLATFQGDGLPLRLFQYATATFSYSGDGKFYFTPVCVKLYDMHIFRIIEKKDRHNSNESSPY